MGVSAERTKVMTNKINGIHKEIMASCQKLHTVTNFKYSQPVMGGQPSAREGLTLQGRT